MKVDNRIPMLRWLVAVVVAGTLGCAPELSFVCEVRASCGWATCPADRPSWTTHVRASNVSDAVKECEQCGYISCQNECTCQQE